MKHKHSPNFIENEREARNATNNRLQTCKWTFIYIVTLLILFSVTKTKAQSDTLRPDNALSVFRDTSKVKGASRYLFGTVIDAGSSVQIRTDTIPVVMVVSDTAANRHANNSYMILSDYVQLNKDNGQYSIIDLKEVNRFEIATPMHYQPYIIYGYEVTSKILSGDAVNTLRFQYYKTTYINHKKQPLPDRIIVWMAIRRKER